MRTRVKICGITNLDDALSAADAGADALGFVFVRESSRYVEPDIACEIIRHLPPMVTAVGVFVNEKIETVREITKHCALDLLQFHGVESPEYCEWYAQGVIKGFRVRDGASLQEISRYRVQGYLLDSYSEEALGGTGSTFDWSLARKVVPLGPVILAGGLTPGNVGQAVDQVRPFAVDVSSGVERRTGTKDAKKIRQFVHAVQETDERNQGKKRGS